MKRTKKLTLLHSNDMHGDFLAEKVNETLVGGVSRLSGYIAKVRNEEKNVLYTIAGDMFQGSLIDSEFLGISTIEIINLLAPDVVTLGNHELDYGLAHLLFLEKCASFPIVNANMYIRLNGVRLFSPCLIREIDGMRILFIGILTEEVLAHTKKEGLIGTLIDVENAATEVARICDAYRTEDIDCTVLLTHIGFENDKKLAALLDPSLGVDIIIGGHSHTWLAAPCVVNGIPIVQAAVGTDQIGRFDLTIDTDLNCLDSYNWQLIPITPENCPRDPALESLIRRYKRTTDEKYSRILTRFPRAYTHPGRKMETELGNLIAECLREQLDVDLMLLASGSIRQPSLGPIVTLKDFVEVFPFEDAVFEFRMTGSQLRRAAAFLLRDASFDPHAHTEWYQFSRGFYCEYDRASHTILSLKMNGSDVTDDALYSVTMQEYHFLSMDRFLDVPHEEVAKNGPVRKVATLARNVLEEYFVANDLITLDGERRLVITG